MILNNYLSMGCIAGVIITLMSGLWFFMLWFSVMACFFQLLSIRNYMLTAEVRRLLEEKLKEDDDRRGDDSVKQ